MRTLRNWIVLSLILIGVRASTTVAQQLPPETLARFYINEADYWTDVGKYLEAMEDLNTALDLAQTNATRAEVMALRATLRSTFLDDPQTAAQDYGAIIGNFAATPFYEPALYQS